MKSLFRRIPTVRGRIDLVLVRATLVVLACAAVMLANRWMVAAHQAEVLRAMLVDQARAVAQLLLDEWRQPQVYGGSRGHPLPGLSRLQVLTPRPAATLLLQQGRPAHSQWDDAPSDAVMRHRLQQPQAQDGLFIDERGRWQAAPKDWQLMPHYTVVEAASDDGSLRVRLLVSLEAPRREQRYLFVQAVGSVAVLLVLMMVFLWSVLRTPRRSLAEASQYAAALPQGPAGRLPTIQSNIAAIDALRSSLNTVADILQAQRQDQSRQQQALQDALHRAETAAEAKRRFLAHMSHEMHTPLNGILGMTRLLLQGQPSAQQRQYLLLSEQASRELQAMVSQVLDLAQAESGQLVLAQQPFQLAALVDGLLPTLQPRAQAKGLALHCELDPALSGAWIGDPERLQQVLAALLDNAVKFTRAGQVRLCLRLDNSLGPAADDGRLALRVEVHDSGPGLRPDQHALVMEAFGQVDNSTGREHGGSGLGLTLCAALLGRMGSRLEIHSQPGQGSCFSFVLRLQPLRGPAQAVPDPVAGPVLPAPPSAAPVQAAMASTGSPTNTPHPTRPDTAGGAPTRPHTSPPADMPTSAPSFASTSTSTTTGAGLPPTPSLAGLSVLLAEDNEVNALVATLTLQQLGAEVAHVQDGRAALDRALAGGPDGHTQAFDLVLMDVQMPGMDGPAACAALRQGEQAQGLPRLPVIAMTAHRYTGSSDPAWRQLVQAGIDGYVCKPFELGLLVQEIQRVLTQAPTRPTAG